MERNTQRLIELTNQLLDFRKIENNTFKVVFTNTNITRVLTEQFESFKTIADAKKITMTFNLPDSPILAEVDIDGFHKILNNLFYNALIYGENKVAVKLYLDEEKKLFYISFSNDGYLIPSSMKEKIFEPFFRLKETQYIQGSGIGLSLSKSLVALHNGKLFLQESSNSMNTFILNLPLQQV